MKAVAIAAACTLAFVASACSSDSDSGGTTIDVAATDTACKPAKTHLSAGKNTFVVKNDGSKVTEMYVYGDGDRVISEVENIGAGTSRKLTVDLKEGDYELACKPGQTGSGIRAKIEVAGHGGHEGGAQAEATREVEIDAVDFKFDGMSGFTAKAGETIKFELINKGAVQHEFEVLDSTGKALGEVEPVDPGKEGEANITLPRAGTYTYVCDIEDHKAKGMSGTFTVTA